MVEVIRDPRVWREALDRASPESKPQVCEQILKIWPSSTDTWLIYLQLTASAEEKGQLLKRALAVCIDTKLFEAYVSFIRETNTDQLAAAYEYALSTTSADPQSGQLWKQYIDWLSVQPIANDWEEQFRRDRVRKAFKRAIMLPLSNIEALWRQYSNFENKISRASARKFIDERSAGYMKARSALKTWQMLTTSVSFDTMPSPETSASEMPAWKNLIEWEHSNPLELEPDDVKKRVEYVATKATQCARWSAELWVYSGLLSGPSFWEQGAEALPESILLAFKCAEFYELEDRFDDVKRVLLNLANSVGSENKDPEGGKSQEETLSSSHNSEQIRTASAAWSELVRVTHRMKGLEQARECLCEALKAISEPSSCLYVTASQLESSNINASRHILSLAYRKFGQSDPDFVVEYLDWLFTHNDVVNARAVFEQCANKQSRKLWDTMLHHEKLYAQSSNVSIKFLKALEKRYCTEFNDVDEVQLFSQRYGSLLTVNQTTKQPPEMFMESFAVPQLLAMLPPANVYDGPMINTTLLMDLLLKFQPNT